MKYIKRVAEKSILRLLKAFPVVGITGPRQSGKSTLLQHLLKDYEYVSFDDIRKIHLFEEDPIGFINRYNEKIIFDEVQNVPEIFNIIKMVVDKDRLNYGNFVLTGSSNFTFLKSVSESLAGRIGLLSLLPFQYQEIPQTQRNESIFKGAYPELVLRNYYESNLWYSSYVDTYINKDLRILANIGDIRDFRRFIQLLASQISQTLDMSHYAKDLGISVPTIKRWISILEASYILFLVPPYHSNHGKRIIKSPKVYFVDTGLISYFTGIQTFEQYSLGPLAGALFENYVISEIYKKELHTLSDAKLYYMRTYDKNEIDLIIDKKTHRDLIEIKKTSTFKSSMVQTLKNESSKNDACYLLYQGEKERYDNISILPFNDFLKKE
ncbi:MAG: ATP-binding protein [Parachlamydiales bacterium]|nr:ATP-binding protein [Parachlamydiales bacterium]